MSFFRRLFFFWKSEANATLDKLENPIKMTEQGIRDLKKDLTQSMEAYAEIRASSIRIKTEADQKLSLAQEYEKKAILLLEKAKKGEIAADEADRLALDVIAKRDELKQQGSQLKTSYEQQEEMSKKLQVEIEKLKKTVSQWENELVTLKARNQTAQASLKINKHMAKIDGNSTVAMLEKMKEKIGTAESLASSYGEIAKSETSLDDRLQSALGSSSASGGLAQLKAQMEAQKLAAAKAPEVLNPANSSAGKAAALDSLAALKAKINQ